MQQNSYSDSFRYIILPDDDSRLTDQDFLSNLGHPPDSVVEPSPINKDHPTDPMQEGEFIGFWKIKVIVGPISIKKGQTISRRERKPQQLEGLTEYTADELKTRIQTLRTR